MAIRKPIPKTQKELSIDQQSPSSTRYGNPNIPIGSNESQTGIDFNRSEKLSWTGDTTKPFSIGLKDLDEAVFYYFENVIKPFVYQNGERREVPIIYGSPERWKQIQKDGYYRDKKGKIMMPLITFKRNNIEKNRTVTNKLDANFPNNISVFEKPYSSKNAYSNFDLLNNKKPIKQYYAVVVPDYVTVTYDFIISTYYVEQLNILIEAMNYASDSYWGDPEKFKFRARIDSFATPVEIQTSGERVVKSTFSLKIHGYIVPPTIQKELASIKKYYGPNQITFNYETTSNIKDI